MKRVLTAMQRFQSASRLTALALLVSLSAFAREGESPMFKSAHEAEGVNQNSEVLVGIDHPSRVGSQQGSRLSDQHFCFSQALARLESKGENEKEDQQAVARRGGLAGCQPTCVRGFTRYEGLLAEQPGDRGQHFATVECAVKRGGKATTPRDHSTRHKELTYANHAITTQKAAQVHQAPAPTPAEASWWKQKEKPEPETLLTASFHAGDAAVDAGGYGRHRTVQCGLRLWLRPSPASDHGAQGAKSRTSPVGASEGGGWTVFPSAPEKHAHTPAIRCNRVWLPRPDSYYALLKGVAA